jgi:hypothetical protein
MICPFGAAVRGSVDTNDKNVAGALQHDRYIVDPKNTSNWLHYSEAYRGWCLAKDMNYVCKREL